VPASTRTATVYSASASTGTVPSTTVVSGCPGGVIRIWRSSAGMSEELLTTPNGTSSRTAAPSTETSTFGAFDDTCATRMSALPEGVSVSVSVSVSIGAAVVVSAAVSVPPSA